MAGGWMLAMLAATMFFNGILADRQNPNRLASLDDQQGDLILEANHYGQYLAEGRINGSEVTFLLDTGATVVAVPRDIAALAGLSEGAEVSVATAAGTAAARRNSDSAIEFGAVCFQGFARGGDSFRPRRSGASWNERPSLPHYRSARQPAYSFACPLILL